MTSEIFSRLNKIECINTLITATNTQTVMKEKQDMIWQPKKRWGKGVIIEVKKR